MSFSLLYHVSGRFRSIFEFMSVVVADQIEKRYGDELVFSKVSLRVQWGDRIGLIGPNGSGKSNFDADFGGPRRPL